MNYNLLIERMREEKEAENIREYREEVTKVAINQLINKNKTI